MSTAKPIGTYRCAVCGRVADGAKLYRDPSAFGERWTCANILCGANVVKISDEPYDADVGRREMEAA